MAQPLKRSKGLAVSFCERCGSVCIASCRQEAMLARARERALVWAGRVA